AVRGDARVRHLRPRRRIHGRQGRRRQLERLAPHGHGGGGAGGGGTRLGGVGPGAGGVVGRPPAWAVHARRREAGGRRRGAGEPGPRRGWGWGWATEGSS